MKKQRVILFLAGLLWLVINVSSVFAQNETYRLVFKREWGVGFPGSVQGRMSLSVRGNLAQVEQVVYWMDGLEMATMTDSPFKFYFNTDDYAPGEHSFYATVSTKAGETFQTEPFKIQFLTGTDAGKLTRRLFIGLGGIAVLIALISFLTARSQRKNDQKGGLGKVGIMGAAICPKCGQAFSRSLFGLNFMFQRYEPCPHCGKWSLTRRATSAEILEAEKKLKMNIENTMPEITDIENPSAQHDPLEESKYTDL